MSKQSEKLREQVEDIVAEHGLDEVLFSLSELVNNSPVASNGAKDKFSALAEFAEQNIILPEDEDEDGEDEEDDEDEDDEEDEEEAA